MIWYKIRYKSSAGFYHNDYTTWNVEKAGMEYIRAVDSGHLSAVEMWGFNLWKWRWELMYGQYRWRLV